MQAHNLFKLYLAWLLIWAAVSHTVYADSIPVSIVIHGNGDGPPSNGPRLPKLLGVNKSPLFEQTGTWFEVSELYKAVSIGSVRTHDEYFDPCKVYLDDTVLLNGSPVASCTPAASVADTVEWSSNSSPPTGTFDYTEVDDAIAAINNAGANVYLRVGESYRGTDQVAHAADYANVAASLAAHVTASASVEFAEVWNEPDGSFWGAGSSAFYDLYDEIVTQVTNPLGLITGGAGFTHNGIENLSSVLVAQDWPMLAHTDGKAFISGHYYGICDTINSNEQNLVNWLDTVNAELAANSIDVPLHVTEWNLELPGANCPYFAQSAHASFTAAALILMSLDEFNIQRSHIYGGIGNGASSLFSPNGVDVNVNPPSYGFWGYSVLASKIRVNTTQSWSGGSGSAADAARAGEQWFAQAGASSFGVTFVLISNDQPTAMNVKVIVSWVPTNPAKVQQVSGITPFAVPASGSPRTVSAADAAAAFAVPSTTYGWTIVGGTAELVLNLPAHSVTVMRFK